MNMSEGKERERCMLTEVIVPFSNETAFSAHCSVGQE